MSPASGLVLGSAVVVTSPALLGAAMGTLPLDVALLRLLISIAGCWLALSLVEALVTPGSQPAAAPVADAAAEAEAPAPERT